MKLTQLAAKPQLVMIEIADEDTIKEFGESLEFWIWDRQPLEKFVKMATMGSSNMGELVDMVNEMVLDDTGKQILTDGLSLPMHVMTKVLNKVVETLGK